MPYENVLKGSSVRYLGCSSIYSSSLGRAITQEQKMKGTKFGKEEVKLSLFSDGIILYVEHSKQSTKKLLELINDRSKIAGYKTNTQKSVVSTH